MSSPLDDLSDELRLAVAELVEQSDLFNLSSTCRSYRALLTPNIFQTILLCNDEQSGLAMQEFLRSNKKFYVKKLHYKGVTKIPEQLMSEIEPVEEEEEEEEEDPKTVLSDHTREVLCDLKQFPNLKQLIVEFPWGEEDISAGFYHFERAESEEQVREREGEDAWRALMARTYAAIGENKSFSTVKSLDLRGVVAKAVSSWWQADFKAFLGSLQDFTLSTIAMENGAGWCQNTNEGYLDFLAKLGHNLTRHLRNVETLSIAGNDEGPIGCQGMRHAPSSLGVEYMPKLRHLYLKYFFLDPPLIKFIENHVKTLETIVLDECFGTGEITLAENGYGWKEFFNRIAATKTKRLVRFDISWENIELPWGDLHHSEDQDSDEFRTGKALLKSGRRAFAYGYLDDKYGMLFQNEDANLEKLVEAEDFKAYSELMNIVKVNATKS
ncbi:hypothetical protein CPB83DRAFT_903469 [Crepidotus variabilis]|uniref:F-box domain-containing protein n=1 Tax=Crepidotus variabilis TaxID=179855 RepID=A0A9P6ENE3_9AGAR|nr:hypothetical protein CPB83DRAFT_903469 [Crepidotus variabilis]